MQINQSIDNFIKEIKKIDKYIFIWNSKIKNLEGLGLIFNNEHIKDKKSWYYKDITSNIEKNNKILISLKLFLIYSENNKLFHKLIGISGNK